MTPGEEMFLSIIIIGAVIVIGYYFIKWLLEFLSNKSGDRE